MTRILAQFLRYLEGRSLEGRGGRLERERSGKERTICQWMSF